MKKLIFVLSAISLLGVSAPSMAAPCKDAKGKFTKCPAKPVAKAKPKQCRDKKGKFIKCAK